MSNISRRAILRSLTASFAGSCAFGAGIAHAAAAATWNFYTYYPVSTGVPARGANRIAEELNKSSAGVLNIRVHLGGSLPIKASSITSSVQNSVVQMADDIFSVGNVPMTGNLRLPMVIHNGDEFERANALMMPFMESAYEKKGVVVLGRYLYPLQTIWSRKKLASLEDLKGQKIRVTSPEQAEFIRRVGGLALTMDTAEVSGGLDRGLVDGVVTAASGGGFVWRDLLKYNLLFPVNYMESLIIVNKAAYDALPEAQRKSVKETVANTTAWMTATLASEEDELRQKMRAAGLVITEAKPAEIKDAQSKMTAYWDEWTKAQTPDVAAAMRKMRDALGR